MLASNGGPTQTIALLPGSPAIGKGSATIAAVTVPPTDQRGVARPSTSIDFGGFQDRGFAITILTGESPQTAAINTPLPIPWRSSLPVRSAIPSWGARSASP